MQICPEAGHPHKRSDPARRRLVRGATETPVSTPKVLEASAAEMGDTLLTTNVAQVPHQSKSGRVAKRKRVLKLNKSPLEFTQRSTGRRFFCLMRPKLIFSHQTRRYVWQTPTTTILM